MHLPTYNALFQTWRAPREHFLLFYRCYYSFLFWTISKDAHSGCFSETQQTSDLVFIHRNAESKSAAAKKKSSLKANRRRGGAGGHRDTEQWTKKNRLLLVFTGYLFHLHKGRQQTKENTSVHLVNINVFYPQISELFQPQGHFYILQKVRVSLGISCFIIKLCHHRAPVQYVRS